MDEEQYLSSGRSTFAKSSLQEIAIVEEKIEARAYFTSCVVQVGSEI